MALRQAAHLRAALFTSLSKAFNASSICSSSLASSAAAHGGLSAALRPLSAASSLRDFLRSLHTSSWAAAAADAPPEGLNPLQQAPPPGGLGAAALGSLPAGALPGEVLRAQAVHRGIKISPDKLNMFAKLIRGMHLEDALIQCRISVKKSAKICEKVLLSAKANAVNNHGLDESRLQVGEAYVGRGTHLKRAWPHGRGRSGVRHRYRAHLTIVLEEGDTPRRTQVVPMLAERRRWAERQAASQARA